MAWNKTSSSESSWWNVCLRANIFTLPARLLKPFMFLVHQYQSLKRRFYTLNVCLPGVPFSLKLHTLRSFCTCLQGPSMPAVCLQSKVTPTFNILGAFQDPRPLGSACKQCLPPRSPSPWRTACCWNVWLHEYFVCLQGALTLTICLQAALTHLNILIEEIDLLWRPSKTPSLSTCLQRVPNFENLPSRRTKLLMCAFKHPWSWLQGVIQPEHVPAGTQRLPSACQALSPF